MRLNRQEAGGTIELLPQLAPREEAEARGAFPNIWRGCDAFLAGRMSEPPKEVEGQARQKSRGRQPEPKAKRKMLVGLNVGLKAKSRIVRLVK